VSIFKTFYNACELIQTLTASIMPTFNEYTQETVILDLMKRQGNNSVPASDI